MSKILNLDSYDLVFTTAFEYNHGISGHLYELIDYYYISSTNNIKSAILLTDGTPIAVFKKAITDKYAFTVEELDDIFSNTFDCTKPKLLKTNNLCVVDGSFRFGQCVIYANNILLLRCSESDYQYFNNHKTIKHAHLLQDFNMYAERYVDLEITVIDYVKKILWSKYKQPSTKKTNTALFYLTTNMRTQSLSDIQHIIDKKQYISYLIITNDVTRYEKLICDNVAVMGTPVVDIFDKFDTYIYTSTSKKADCSPRFIVECAVFNKEVIYNIDYFDIGIECRKRAIEKDVNSLQLTNNDFFVDYVKKLINDSY